MTRPADDPIAREFRLHLDIIVDELISSGWDPVDARREAARRFGDSASYRQQCRSVRHEKSRSIRVWIMVEGVLNDFRQALRGLRRVPGFAITAVLTLALGIGATTTVFSVVDTLVLRPLPYPDSHRLVKVGTMFNGRTEPSSSSPLNFFDWRELNDVFESLAASRMESHTIINDGFPESVTGAGVSAGFFELLGASPMLGRAIRADDDRAGAPRVVVLRHRTWQSRWGGDRNVVGRTVMLGDLAYTIVGVMPSDFHPPEAIHQGGVDLWIPLAHISDDLQQRDNGFLQAIGRLRPDITPSLAAASMTALQQRINENIPVPSERVAEFRSGLRVGVVSLLDETVGDNSRVMWMFLGAVGLLLAIACANVANLFLARSADRGRELALRVALGAGRGRVMRQLLTESVTLAMTAGVAGVVLAIAGVRAFVALAPADLPRLGEVAVDLRVLVFSAVVSIATGLVFGIAPAARYARGNARDALQEGALNHTAGRNKNRLRRTLVAIEAAVAVVLLIGAGLLVNSFVRLTSADPGFDPDGVVRMALFIGENYETGESRAVFFDDLVERIRSVPGVTHAAATSDLPMTDNQSISGITAEGVLRDQTTEVSFHRVTVGFFETLRVPLLAGRDFAPSDRSGEPVAIVNEAFAREMWPDGEVLGRRFKFGDANSDAVWMVIVGVVPNIHQHALGDLSGPAAYLYHARSPFVFGNVIARSAGDPSLVMTALRRELQSLDDRQAIRELGLLTDQMSVTVTRPRFNATLLGSFALVAMLITSVGVYGAISYIVRQRAQEVGIRMALGASGRAVTGLVVRQGLGTVLFGVAVGLAVAIPLSRVLDAFVYGIGTTDVRTYVGVTGLLVAVAAVACWIPARRAVRVDPAVTLRAE